MLRWFRLVVVTWESHSFFSPIFHFTSLNNKLCLSSLSLPFIPVQLLSEWIAMLTSKYCLFIELDKYIIIIKTVIKSLLVVVIFYNLGINLFYTEIIPLPSIPCRQEEGAVTSFNSYLTSSCLWLKLHIFSHAYTHNMLRNISIHAIYINKL